MHGYGYFKLSPGRYWIGGVMCSQSLYFSRLLLVRSLSTATFFNRLYVAASGSNWLRLPAR